MFKGRLSLLLLIGLLVLVLPACAGTPAAPTAPTMPPLPTEVGQPAQAAPASGLGIIQSVTMAGDVAADTFEPVNPTINFVNPPVLHVVVTIQDAPADTAVRVDWFSGSAGTAPPDASLGTYSITADGSRNLDYSFQPGAQMAPGAYYVRVFLNEEFFLRVNFYVTDQ